jgi:hypothetical protein
MSVYLPSHDSRLPLAGAGEQVQAPISSWRKEAEDPNFFKALEQNVGILETSLRGGSLVAPEFLAILQKDVDMLRAVYRDRNLKSNSKELRDLNALNLKLGELAAKYFDKGVPGSSKAVEVPEARPRVNMDVYEAEVSESDLRELINCSVLSVKGDGHCLFRTVAAHLLTQEHLAELKRRVDMLQKMVPHDIDIKRLIEDCEALLKQNKSVDEILLTPGISERWIKALRSIATEYWSTKFRESPTKDPVPTFIQTIRASGVEGSDDDMIGHYMSTMGSFDLACWGGHQEIIALSESLQIPIHIIDLETPRAQRSEPLLPAVANLSDIYVLRRPGHYDAIYLEKAPKPRQTPSIGQVD